MITLIVVIFVIGYLVITLEHPLKFNKTATALLTGILIWTTFAIGRSQEIGWLAFLGYVGGALTFLGMYLLK